MRVALLALAIAATSSSLAAQSTAMQPVTPASAATTSPDSMVLAIAQPVALRAGRSLAAEPAPAPAPLPRGFAQSGFAQFMSSPAGRILRVVAGAGMIAGGIAADSDGGTIVAALGAVPLSAGAFDVCFLSPLFGGPFTGKAIRAAK